MIQTYLLHAQRCNRGPVFCHGRKEKRPFGQGFGRGGGDAKFLSSSPPPNQHGQLPFVCWPTLPPFCQCFVYFCRGRVGIFYIYPDWPWMDGFFCQNCQTADCGIGSGELILTLLVRIALLAPWEALHCTSIGREGLSRSPQWWCWSEECQWPEDCSGHFFFSNVCGFGEGPLCHSLWQCRPGPFQVIGLGQGACPISWGRGLGDRWP